MFRCVETRTFPGTWAISFHGRKVRVPLRPESMWLDWDSALSVLGHEPEIKATYETFIRESSRLHCVFDVGANYGLHSLLFLVHGVQVVSFEPNSMCHEYMRSLEEPNDVKFSIEHSALGSWNGVIELCYPDTETWLGTTDPERSREMSSKYRIRRMEVPSMTIDSYVQRTGRVPDLIKLDTEGTELQVLDGATQTLDSVRPALILECWRNNLRDELWHLLDGMAYSLVELPLLSLDEASPIGLPAFRNSEASNFAALPHEKLVN